MYPKRMRYCLVALLLLGILMIGGTIFGEGEQVGLRLRLHQGDIYRIKVLITDNLLEQRKKDKREIITTHEIGYRFEVTGIDINGNYKFKMNYDSFLFKRNPTEEPELLFDLTNLPVGDAALIKLGTILKEKSFYFNLTPSGKIFTISEIEPFQKEIKDLVEAQTLPVKEIATEFIRLHEEKTFLKSLQQLFIALPDMPVACGEKWKGPLVSFYDKTTRYFNSEIDYVLKEIKDGCSHIDRSKNKNTTFTTSLKNSKSEENYLINEIVADIWIRNDNGWPVKGSINRIITGTKKEKKTWNVLWETSMKFETLK